MDLSLVVVALGLTLVLSSALPIYPDEIITRMLLERYFVTGGYRANVTRFCSDNLLIAVPFAETPAAVLWSSLVYFDSQIIYRAIPIGLLVLATATLLLYGCAAPVARRPQPWWLLLFASGVGSYGLVILRAEIFFAAALAFIAMAGLHIAANPGLRTRRIVAVAVGVAALYVVVGFVHAKALYLVLPVLVVLGLAVRRVWPRKAAAGAAVILIGVVLASTHGAMQMHKSFYYACRDFPKLIAADEGINVNPLDAIANPAQFSQGLQIATSQSVLKRALSQALFKKDYDIAVLPPVPSQSRLVKWTDGLIALCIALALLTVLAFTIREALESFRSRRLRPAFLLYLSIEVVVLTLFMLNISKNWYEISLALFNLGLLAYLAGLVSSRSGEPLRTPARAAQATVSVVFLATLGLSIFLNHRFVYERLRAGYEGPGITLALDLRRFVRFAQDSFPALHRDRTAPVIVDDLTYHAFRGHQHLYPVTYLMFNAMSHPETLDIVAGKHSQLVGLTRCSLWEDFKEFRSSSLVRRVVFESPQAKPVEICEWVVTLWK